MIFDSLLKQAIQDFDKKKFQKSINLFEIILEENPHNSEIIININDLSNTKEILTNNKLLPTIVSSTKEISSKLNLLSNKNS